jgi:hypothetical protein
MVATRSSHFPMSIDLDPLDSKPRYGSGEPAHTLLASIIERNRVSYRSHLQSFVQYQEDLVSIPERTTLIEPAGLNIFAVSGERV